MIWNPAGREDYTMLAAADINGFACTDIVAKQAKDGNDPTKGNVNGERFLLWINNSVVSHLGSYTLREARSIVVMDNAAIHHVAGVREAIEATGAILVYTSSYSADLNPIEFTFHTYKAILRRYHYGLLGDIKDTHVAAVQAVTC